MTQKPMTDAQFAALRYLWSRPGGRLKSFAHESGDVLPEIAENPEQGCFTIRTKTWEVLLARGWAEGSWGPVNEHGIRAGELRITPIGLAAMQRRRYRIRVEDRLHPHRAAVRIAGRTDVPAWWLAELDGGGGEQA